MNVCQNVIVGSRLFPSKPAIVFDQQSLSYSDLERLSGHAAAVLRDRGVKRGDRVGIVIGNVPAFAVWYFAALRLGAVAVSVSTRLAAKEVAFILSDCDAQILVTTDNLEANLRDDLPSCTQTLVSVSEDGMHCDGRSLNESAGLADGEFVDTEPHDPATILYTSGTTGFPKGATLSHQNIRATVHAFNHLCRMETDDVLLLAVPLFHCYGQNALLNSGLNVGVTLVLQRGFDLNESKQLIQQHKVTKLFGVPTTFQLMLEYCTPDELASLQYCFSAAATLPPQVAAQWRERFAMPVFEGYGLTETAPFASYNHEVQFKPGSIGTPVDLVEMKIVDTESGTDCPVNTPGEIVIRGPNVMLGYWNRAEETAEAIRDGWFHSGDIGMMDEDGYFFIVDRLKDMISIGGMKVFPAEVERVMLDHPQVADVAVVGLPDDVLGERVVAFVVPSESESPGIDSIVQHCQPQLGSYKTPKRIELVEQLPRNPAGKVLKTQLREQWSAVADQNDQPARGLLAGLQPSTTEVEPAGAETPAPVQLSEESPLFDRLERIHPTARVKSMVSWLQEDIRRLADLDELPDPDTLFVDAGLDSLMIVELRDHLQVQVGARLELAATMVFDYPRIVDLAGFLVESFERIHAGDQPPVPADKAATDQSSSAEANSLVDEIQDMSEQEALRELLRELDE